MMKYITFILGLTFLVNIEIKSQNYVPFPIENVNWNVLYAGTCDETPADTILIRYTIHGDTLVNNTQYAKLCVESGDTINPKIQSIGGLRETDKKIYYRGKTILGINNNVEYLLYDFTKQIGDTIKHNVNSSFYSVVLDIDSVLIGDHYRKRYRVDNHWFYQNPDYIIEGIGSVNNGLLGHISDITTCGHHYWEHICFRENGIIKYLNPSFNECFPNYTLNSIKKEEFEDRFEIFPNPFYNEIKILNLSSYKDLTLKLVNITGKIITEKKIKNTINNVKLEISSGIYNAIILDKQGKILISKRIIKQ